MAETATRHIFISYSHYDEAFVDRLNADLAAANIHFWIDRSGLAPGTPMWEQAIREAIEDASTILLVASPNSRVSPAVQGEVSIGRNRRKRVIPLWVDGDEWYDCVSIEMVNYHYLDFRGDRYTTARDRLISLLRQMESLPVLLPLPSEPKKPTPGGSVLVDVGLGENDSSSTVQQTIEATAYETVDALYSKYLWGEFPLFTYGIEWILASKTPGVQRLVAPWTWLTLVGSQNRISQQMALRLYTEWGGLPPETFGMTDKSQWDVIDIRKRPIPTIGLATNNDAIARLVGSLSLSDSSTALQAALKLAGVFHVFMSRKGSTYLDGGSNVHMVPSSAVQQARYPHMFAFVFTGMATGHESQTIILDTQADKTLPSWL